MKNKKSFMGVVFGYIAIVVLLFALELGIERAEGTVTSIYSGWQVSCSGRSIPNQEIEDLSETGLLPLAKGTEISFTHLLPDMQELELPSLMIEAGKSAVLVFLDNNLVDQSESVLSYAIEVDRILIVGLPEDYAQKEIKITLTVTEPEQFTGLAAPRLGSYEDLMRIRGNDAVVALLTGFFMMLFGLISLVILTIRYIPMKRPDAYVMSALLTFMLGFWLSMSADLQTLFLPMLDQKQVVIMAMICSVILFLFYWHAVPKSLRKRLKNKKYEQMTSGEVLLLFDVFGLFVILMMQTVFTALDLSFKFGLGLYLKRVLPFFAALVIIMRAYRYSTFVKEVYVKRDENESLFKIAYGDALTGLYNRACWDERMRELDQSDKPYCIISMDLDGLKTVNDTMGHEGGDRLIKGFAKTLSESFKEPHFIARVGGDEFVVIMMTDSEKEVKKCLATLDSKQLAMDKKEKDMVHRCSYGYEFSDSVRAMQKSEDSAGTNTNKDNQAGAEAANTATGGNGASQTKHTAHDIYMLADAKMYKIKQGHKAAKKAVAMTQSDSTEAKVAEVVKKTLREMNGEPAEEEAETKEPTGSVKSHPAEGKQISLETDADVRKAMANLRTPIHRANAPQEGAPLSPRAAAVSQTYAQVQAAAKAQMGQTPKNPEQTVAQIQENEIRQVAKEAKVKKALQVLEEAQKAQK